MILSDLLPQSQMVQAIVFGNPTLHGFQCEKVMVCGEGMSRIRLIWADTAWQIVFYFFYFVMELNSFLYHGFNTSFCFLMIYFLVYAEALFMKPKNQNALFALAIFFLIFFNGAQLTLAESGTSNTSTSSQTTSNLAGLLFTWWICNSRKREAIGGWLLFYYIKLFVFTLISIRTLAENLNIATWGNETMQYFLYVASVIPADITLIIELIFGSMLLSKKFRNRKIYNFLRITLITNFGFGLIAFLIESKYCPENIALDVSPMIGSVVWFLYFTLSKRVKMVFIENNWDPDTMYPANPPKKPSRVE